MPCNFISSCFFIESPWSREQEDCVTGAGGQEARGNRAQNQLIDRAGGPIEVQGEHWRIPFDPDDPDPDWQVLDQQPVVQQQAEVPDGGAADRDMAAGTSAGGGVAEATPANAASTNSSNTAVKTTRVAKTFRAYLPSCHRTYSCVHCRAHLANHDELISKSFQGSQGRAYLFNSVVNIGCGPAEERVLLTGLHAVADIYCDCCKTTLGWKYEQAYESSQKYKEGKFIIELAHMIKENGWENES